MTKYFEDIDVGTTLREGSFTVAETDIVEFAEQFDPQPFHTDPAAAKDYMWDDLIASGWHTAAICHRLGVEAINRDDWAAGAGLGVTELEWPRPVFAGDSITVELEVLEKRPRESKPDYGTVTTQYVGYNQDDKAVIRYLSRGIIRRNTSNRD